MAIKQTSSVDAYINDFVIRAAQVPKLSDSHSLGFFLNGLREDIRVRLRSHETTDISCTMLLARKVEWKLLITYPHIPTSRFFREN